MLKNETEPDCRKVAISRSCCCLVDDDFRQPTIWLPGNRSSHLTRLAYLWLIDRCDHTRTDCAYQSMHCIERGATGKIAQSVSLWVRFKRVQACKYNVSAADINHSSNRASEISWRFCGALIQLPVASVKRSCVFGLHSKYIDYGCKASSTDDQYRWRCQAKSAPSWKSAGWL